MPARRSRNKLDLLRGLLREAIFRLFASLQIRHTEPSFAAMIFAVMKCSLARWKATRSRAGSLPSSMVSCSRSTIRSRMRSSATLRTGLRV